MNRKTILLLLLLTSLFLGCGGGNSASLPHSDDSNQSNEENSSTSDENQSNPRTGKAQLGVLAEATVKLYELNHKERTLLATDFTTRGESIKRIGNFDLHLEKLEKNRLYLYEVSGGEDYDVDDDGILDLHPTPNQGLFHLIALGSHIMSLKKLNVTAVSEIIYQKLQSQLNLEPDAVVAKMSLLSQEIIDEDLNGDGFVGIEDLLKYDPIADKTKIKTAYQENILQIIDNILNNKDSDFDAPLFEEESSIIQLNENLTFIKKITIKDSSEISIKLLGEDADAFIYNIQTQELSFKTSVNFESPHDKNLDNIFDLTIEATDSYLNKSRREFSIEILDIDETIPLAPILKDTQLNVDENAPENTLVGSVIIENQGSKSVRNFRIIGEASLLFQITNQGEIFTQKSFDFETNKRYTILVEAENEIGISNQISVEILISDLPDIIAIVKNVTVEALENRPIGTVIGQIEVADTGDSPTNAFLLYGEKAKDFHINSKGDIIVDIYLDYESTNRYYLQYSTTNEAGESEKSELTIKVNNIFEYSENDYPPSEIGVQNALDNGDYDFVLNELLNNRDAYDGLDNDQIDLNIAGAYVGSSGYTIYDISGAMNEGNESNFNDFVQNITKDNDAVTTINQLQQADNYYSNIVQNIDCNNSSSLSQLQKDSCHNLGLVRLTSLTNSVKLLFGGESNTVEKWAEGVEVNSSDDLNGNGVLDASEASACAVVYANNPNNSCQNGTAYSYRGGIEFSQQNRNYNLRLIEVDVGNSSNGYQNFYQLITTNPNNNSPVLTSGICDRLFQHTNQPADGITYFPCPALDNNAEIMEMKSNLENIANIQSLFPDGDETKEILQNYLINITGSSSGTIGLDNLSEYLRTH